MVYHTIQFEEDGNTVSVALAVIMKYGYSIPKACKAVQERVKTAIETMASSRLPRLQAPCQSILLHLQPPQAFPLPEQKFSRLRFPAVPYKAQSAPEVLPHRGSPYKTAV